MAKDNRRLNAQDTAALQNAEDQVGAIDAQAASFKNLLSLTLQENAATKEMLKTRKELAGLGKDQIKNAQEYEKATIEIQRLEKKLQTVKAINDQKATAFFKVELAAQKQLAEEK